MERKFTNKGYIIFLYLSRILNTLIAFLITIVITHKLGSTILYGRYSYFLTITHYVAVFIGFGFNDALMNLMIFCSREKARELSALGYVFNFLFSVLFILCIFIIHIFDEQLVVNYVTMFFLQGILLSDLLNKIAIALKKTAIMIFNNLLVNVTILLLYIAIDTQFYNYCMIYCLINFIYTNGIFVFALKPKACNFKQNFNITFSKIKEYGFNVYLGGVASMGTYDMDKLLLRGCSQIQEVGFYNIGLSCTGPITMFSESLMNILFRDLAKEEKISSQYLLVNFIWLLFVSIAFATIGKYIFILIFGSKYSYVAENFTGFAILAFFRGLFVPYNNFLAVKSCGKYLRNTAFILTISNVIFNLLLIPYYKMRGAIYATIISLVIDNIAHYYYYLKVIGKNKIKGEKYFEST